MELGAVDPWGAAAAAGASAAAAPVGSAGPSPPHTVPLPSASGPWGAAPADPWGAASPASPQSADPWGGASPPTVAPPPPDPWGETTNHRANNVDPWGPTAGEWLLLPRTGQGDQYRDDPREPSDVLVFGGKRQKQKMCSVPLSLYRKLT